MPPTAEDVEAAAARVDGRVKQTPLLESPVFNEIAKCRVLVKAECMQVPGSFKIRGATNRILCLSDGEKASGVIAFSSGNFGKGLACAAKGLGVPCVIVVPEDAPGHKKDGIRGFGAKVLESPVVPGENREVTAAKLAEEHSKAHSMTLLHPFEDHDVIAGQGTAAMEVITTLTSRGLSPWAVVIPAGGGGLSAGCNLILEKHFPSAETYIVEPEGYNDHQRSFETGCRERVPVDAPKTICDALQAVSPGVNTFPINARTVKACLTVSDSEVQTAQTLAKQHFNLHLEPSGACALAAVIHHKVTPPAVDSIVVVIASGGDPSHAPLPETVFS
eukprot:TRINITY_DN24158_c0_g1_i2.p2 TRINITY_DN24158_c0_g1~~TRINITY_DN24158_c0_g1_i2.p2  ORF type:complete len:332 (+),score=51.30 TRINITY_DN24158_c0_g1_i2:40-1035(+)